MRASRRVSLLSAVALVVTLETPSAGLPADRPSADPKHDGLVVIPVACPDGRGLGVASHPGPTVAVARRFLLAQRDRSREGTASVADR